VRKAYRAFVNEAITCGFHQNIYAQDDTISRPRRSWHCEPKPRFILMTTNLIAPNLIALAFLALLFGHAWQTYPEKQPIHLDNPKTKQDADRPPTNPSDD
jgi:hypothetical protein